MFCKDFHRTRVGGKARKNLDFRFILGGRSDKKSTKHSVEKCGYLDHRVFCVFLTDFNNLGCFRKLGGVRKLYEIAKKLFWGAFGTRFGLRNGFGRDVQAIFVNF